MIPYMIETIPIDEDGNFKYENNLNDEESRLFSLTIKDSLCEMPYACGMLFQNFAYRTGSTYSEATGYKLGDDL